MYMCICTCVYTHSYIQYNIIYYNVCICICTCVYTHSYIQYNIIYYNVCICICTCVYTHSYIQYNIIYYNVCICICTCVYTHIYIQYNIIYYNFHNEIPEARSRIKKQAPTWFLWRLSSSTHSESWKATRALPLREETWARQMAITSATKLCMKPFRPPLCGNRQLSVTIQQQIRSSTIVFFFLFNRTSTSRPSPLL